MSEHDRRLVAARDVAPDRRRGGEIRVLLGPRTVGSTSGFMGVANLAPGERIAEHYHPYSEEFLYVARGELIVDLDDEPVPVRTGEALYVPVNVRHRLRNVADQPAEVVFQLGPLAPRPELGHVDTESAAEVTEPAAATAEAAEAVAVAVDAAIPGGRRGAGALRGRSEAAP